MLKPQHMKNQLPTSQVSLTPACSCQSSTIVAFSVSGDPKLQAFEKKKVNYEGLDEHDLVINNESHGSMNIRDSSKFSRSLRFEDSCSNVSPSIRNNCTKRPLTTTSCCVRCVKTVMLIMFYNRTQLRPNSDQSEAIVSSKVLLP